MSDTQEVTAFKKFEGKMLAGAVTLVIGLTSAVWAITWNTTNNTAQEARAEVEKIRIKAASTDEKVKALEANLEHMRVTLDDILKELRRR